MSRIVVESEGGSKAECHACSRPFPTTAPTNVAEGISPVGRYKCPECNNEFCSDCDIFVHEVVHCCPGCGK